MISSFAFPLAAFKRQRLSASLLVPLLVGILLSSLHAQTSLKQISAGTLVVQTAESQIIGTPLPNPDFTITALDSTPAGPIENSATALTATVLNGGTAAAPATSVNFYLGSTLVGSAPVKALAVGDSTTVSADIGTLSAGSYQADARVNESNSVIELSSGNNSLTQNITVSPALVSVSQEFNKTRTIKATAAASMSTSQTQVTSSSLTTGPSGRGAVVPYTRYESEDGVIGAGAVLHTDPTFDYTQLAAEASNQAYVALPASGAYVEWTVASGGGGAGVTLRFTMPDSSDGMGLTGSLDCYVNGTKLQTIALSSYWSWQYFVMNDWMPKDAPSASTTYTAFKFDEVHWKLATPLVAGDKIRIQSSVASGLEYGVDFIEIEPVPAAISQPANSVSVTDYGAVGDGSTDCWSAFNSAVAAAVTQGKSLYIPAGKFNLSNMWFIGSFDSPINSLTITGAGMWYTNIQFTGSAPSGGGISFHMAAKGKLDFGNMYLNSMLRSRYDERANYKCFMDDFGTNSHIHDFWEEHFECGFWVADYDHDPAIPADGLLIENGRIRNNLADGCNFCQGTKNSTVQNCSVRNNGDDGLACWPANYNNAPMEVNNSYFHNTIENDWRASGIALAGGSGNKIQYNLIKDTYMAAGIRLVTTFPGFHFENNSGILISDSTLINCGTSQDIGNTESGAIQLEATTGPINNITFTNIDIIDAQRSAIQVGKSGGFTGVVFNNIHIDGTGVDATTDSVLAAPHGGAAFFAYTNNGTITFNDLTYVNVENIPPLIIPAGFNVIINNAAAPTITTQPQGQTVMQGASVQFSVTANGVPAPTYQWYHNGSAFSGATGTTLSIASALSTDAGDYTVVVTNSAGSVTSAKATLTVNAPPVTPSEPSSGGGGGAIDIRFLFALLTLVGARRCAKRQL